MKTIDIKITKTEAQLISSRNIDDQQWQYLCDNLGDSIEEFIKQEIQYLLDNPE